MARKRNEKENPDENRDLWPGDDEWEQPHDAAAPQMWAERAAEDEPGDAANAGEHAGEEERHDAALPTESDLEARGFTPDEVQRLRLVSDRQAQSDESQVAEAMLRRLRFTRWLIDHGMLDEWSA